MPIHAQHLERRPRAHAGRWIADASREEFFDEVRVPVDGDAVGWPNIAKTATILARGLGRL
ncbi:hypothetical protein ABGB14_37800 [Nonomuraea sp. B10E15]|uniref:hypothetical protein n=1 Tax=Nonomuraea sp. B10E15 TaxID=3153560 RepID=UPI00325C9E3E